MSTFLMIFRADYLPVRTYVLDGYRKIVSLPMDALVIQSSKNRDEICQEIEVIANTVFSALRDQMRFLYQQELRKLPIESINAESAAKIDLQVKEKLAESFHRKFEQLQGSILPLVDGILANAYTSNIVYKVVEQILLTMKNSDKNSVLSALDDDDIRYFTVISPVLNNAVDKA